ncbi:MAG: hypothetical protein AAB448_01590 [Patescibacteria group bacterium]
MSWIFTEDEKRIIDEYGNGERNWFHLYESYPKDNALDMMYEPWHWHYEKG